MIQVKLKRIWYLLIGGLLLLAIFVIIFIHKYFTYNSIDRCRKILANNNDYQLERAAHELVNNFKPDDIRKAIPEIIYIIKNDSSPTADICAEALGRLDIQAKNEVLPILLEIIENNRSSNMYSAAPEALGRMGEIAIPYLLEWIKGRNVYHQRVAVRGLHVMQWLPSTPEDRAWWLAAQGKWVEVVLLGSAAIPAISNGLFQEVGRSSIENRELIHVLKNSTRNTIPLLHEMALRTSDQQVSSIAIDTLTNIAGHDEEAWKILESVLPRVSLDIQLHVATMFDNKQSDKANEIFRNILTNPNVTSNILLTVATKLGMQRENNAIEVLKNLLNNPDSTVQLSAAEALWKCGIYDNLVNMDSMPKGSLPKNVKYYVIANDRTWDISSYLSQEARASKLSQSNILICVKYSEEVSYLWRVNNDQPAKHGVINVVIVDHENTPLLQKEFVGGLIGYHGNVLEQGGVDYSGSGIHAKPYSAEHLKREVVSWVNTIMRK